MDESYEQLLIAEKRRRQQSIPLNCGRVFIRAFHKALVCVISAVFYLRTVIDTIVQVIRRILLSPWDLLLCIAFKLWVRNRSTATYTHLDLSAVRDAFWNGDSIVITSGLRTFFIKKKSAVATDPLAPSQDYLQSEAQPQPQEPIAPPLHQAASKLPSQKARAKKPRYKARWRMRKRNVEIKPNAFSPATPLTAETLHQTIVRHRKLRARKARIREKFKRS